MNQGKYNSKGLEMLVLTRLKDESIMIGDDIEIMTVRINAESVRIGTTAPESVPVHRKEIYKAIKEQNNAVNP